MVKQIKEQIHILNQKTNSIQINKTRNIHLTIYIHIQTKSKVEKKTLYIYIEQASLRHRPITILDFWGN